MDIGDAVWRGMNFMKKKMERKSEPWLKLLFKGATVKVDNSGFVYLACVSFSTNKYPTTY